jgi:acyl carrier protein
LTPDQGTSALQRFLRRPRAQVGFFHFAPRHWLEFYPHMAAQPFLSELLKDAAAAPPRQSFSVALLAAMPAERPRLLEGHLREQIARVLRLSPERIDRLAPFRSLGVDSLLTLEARNRLEASLGLKLAATLLFTYANIAVLAEYLLLQVAPPATLERVAPLAPGPVEGAAAVDPDAEEDDLLAAFDASARLAKKELLS